MGLKHAQKDEKRADHHACATFASLAVDHDHRLIDVLWTVGFDTHFTGCQLVVLLHTLQE